MYGKVSCVLSCGSCGLTPITRGFCSVALAQLVCQLATGMLTFGSVIYPQDLSVVAYRSLYDFDMFGFLCLLVLPNCRMLNFSVSGAHSRRPIDPCVCRSWGNLWDSDIWIFSVVICLSGPPNPKEILLLLLFALCGL